MDSMKIKLGIIGNGFMVREHHLPYLVSRIKYSNDIEIAWVKGCLCTPEEKKGCPFEKSAYTSSGSKLDSSWKTILTDSDHEKCNCEPGMPGSWKSFFLNNPVDGILVSLPNALHFETVNSALENNINVAVEKPTTLTLKECRYLVELANNKNLIFLTGAQRRYEDIYTTISDKIIKNGSLGEPQVINYLMSRGYTDEKYYYWQHKKSLGGGGSLIADGYHGIDIVLWLLKQGGFNITPKAVSANLILDSKSPYPASERVERAAMVKVLLSNGGLFSIMTSYIAPSGSLDENIKIFGTKGAIRLIRDRTLNKDMSAGTLTFQNEESILTEYDTRGWTGKRYAPLEDFLNNIINKKEGNKWEVKSPASDSIDTINIIEAAYQSANNCGQEIFLDNNNGVGNVLK